MRRGLTLRILIALAFALTTVVVVMFSGLYWLRRSELEQGFPIPLPRQVAAIVETIEATPPDRVDTLLEALNSSGLLVTVLSEMPEFEHAEVLPRMRRALEIYLDGLGGRPVDVFVGADGSDIAPAVIAEKDELRATRPVRIVVGLQDGRFVNVEAYGETLRRFTGVRLALGMLITVLFVGVTTLWMVRRQIGPIERLAEAVDGIGGPVLPALPEDGPREVRNLVLAMERMHRRIEDLLTARTRMLAAIGHDFGTYLSRLRLRAEFIGDDAQREKAIADIEDMHALMTDTLTLARLEERRDPIVLDLTQLVRRLVDSAASVNEPVTMHDGGTVWIEGHSAAIARAVSNLIGNAVKYGGRADVTVVRRKDMAEVRVEDEGPGILLEEREAVLEPFYRSDQSRNLDSRRFGLGLAIVADIVRRHGGEIELADRPGGGLRASIFFPALPHDPERGLPIDA